MQEEGYRNLIYNEGSHWWHAGKRSIVSSMLSVYTNGNDKDTLVLEAGCGVGSLFSALANSGRRVIGVDKSEKALSYCRNKGYYKLNVCNCCKLSFADEAFDLVVVVDLLEHMEEDGEGIKEFFRVLKKGGRLLVFVPAFHLLWSDLDEIGHHFRRYTRFQLERKLEQAGFVVLKASYANTILFLPILLIRLVQRLLKRFWNFNSASLYVNFGPANRLLARIFSSEAVLLKYLNFSFGSSVICVAERVK